MHHSKYFDYFGHIREELPDYETNPIHLLQLPEKKKKSLLKKKQQALKGRKRKMTENSFGKENRVLGK